MALATGRRAESFHSKGRFAIGHGNSTVNPTKDYTAALTAANTPSPTEDALSHEALHTLDWAAKGDYTDPHSGGIFVNYADPAMLHRNAELASNEAGQGIEGLGIADPNYLATVKANRAAHQDEINAGQYESDIKEGVSAATGVAGDVSKLDLSRKMGVLGTTKDVYQANANKPKWWQYLLQAGAGAAGPVAEAI
jgi:hypothetical protein